jgi:hypothetical protein
MRDMGCLWMGVFMVEDGGYLAVRNNMMCVCTCIWWASRKMRLSSKRGEVCGRH